MAYQPHLLGAKGPRRMTVLLPRLDAAGRRAAFRPAADGPRGGMLDRRAPAAGRPVLTQNNGSESAHARAQAHAHNDHPQ